MEFTLDNVQEAIRQLYHGANCHQEMNTYLMAAQVSPQAWTLAWQLLQTKIPEEQFFGAGCLHIKIARYWHEVSAEQIPQLRNQLLQQIANFAMGPKPVLTRLCVALSSLVLHTVPEKWSTPVLDIMTMFQQHNLPHLNSSQVCLVLLDILTVLPEEIFTCQFAQQRKAVIRNELQKNTQQVLSLLQSLFSGSTPGNIQEQALRCFGSWVQFGIPLTDVMGLVQHIFDAIHNTAYLDTSVDTLIQVFTHPDGHRFPSSMLVLLPQILQLQEKLQKAIQESDMDTCQSLCRLVVTAADQNSQLILGCSLMESEQRQMALNLVNFVLQCTNIPGHYPVDECCSDLPFGFWYNLQDEILAADPAKFVILAQIYCPIYMSLVGVLLQKGRFPPESEFDSWNGEEKESHRCYRQDIADTFMYAYNFLHEPMLESLCAVLGSILDRSKTEQVPWQELEAVLFAVTSVAESVDMEECAHLPQLFSVLARLPYTSPQLVSQALSLIGSYAEWLSGHPEFLGSVIPLMLQGLKNTELGQSATLALKEVVRENQDHLQPYCQDILTASKIALDSGILRSRDGMRLMLCLGYVLSVVPVSDGMEYLRGLLAPYIQHLQQLATAEPSASSKAATLNRINSLSWLFTSLNVNRNDSEDESKPPQPKQPQPVLLILQDVLPVIQQVLQHWISDSGVVESVCEMLRKALRTLLDDFGVIAEPTAELLGQMYQAVPHPSLIEFAKQLLIYFASSGEYEAMAVKLFHIICVQTLTVFQTNISENPELAEGFFSFLAQLAKKHRKLFMKENCNLVGLFQAGVLGLSMNEQPTVKAACYFLSEILSCADAIPTLKVVVATHGHTMVDKVMRAVGGELPRSLIESMADIFLALNKYHFDELCKWLNAMVQQDGFPCARATKQEKEGFTRQLLKERVNKRKIKEILNEYTLLWRGLLGTEYAAQTSKVLGT